MSSTTVKHLKMSPSIDVIIPTFRRSDMLTRAIEAVFNQGYLIQQVFLVYRPDDDPQVEEWLKENAGKWKNLTPIAVYVAGKVAALNAALSQVSSEVVLMIDDDIVLREGWLDRIIRHYEDPRVAAVGGRDFVHGPGGSAHLQPQRAAGCRNAWGKVIGNHHVVVGPAREVDVLKGCNWSIRLSAIGSLRFDERLLGIGAQAGDDYWFCLNLRHQGWKIILDPSATVDHYPAFKPDYAQGSWGSKKCYEWTANITAHNLAFLPLTKKLLYLLHSVAIGVRHCPGMYYIGHSLLKRPRSLPGQLKGGWTGFAKGIVMSREFELNPPGRAEMPPATKSSRR